MALKQLSVTTEILEMKITISEISSLKTEHTKMRLKHDLKNQLHPARLKQEHHYRQ